MAPVDGDLGGLRTSEKGYEKGHEKRYEKRLRKVGTEKHVVLRGHEKGYEKALFFIPFFIPY